MRKFDITFGIVGLLSIPIAFLFSHFSGINGWICFFIIEFAVIVYFYNAEGKI